MYDQFPFNTCTVNLHFKIPYSFNAKRLYFCFMLANATKTPHFQLSGESVEKDFL